MSKILQIQDNIFCEPCKDCGARPIIEQTKGAYLVRCPKSKDHYQTKAGIVDIKDWNLKNKVHTSLGSNVSSNPKKAS